MSHIEQELSRLNMSISDAAAPVGTYVGYTRSGNTVYVSGQLPLVEGAIAVTGQLGDGVTIDDGYRAAQICALNLLAQVKVACDGDLGRVVRVVKLGGFVSAVPSFTDAPKCINGASDLMVELFGEAGRHARFAVGVASLPGGAAVEIDGVFEIK